VLVVLGVAVLLTAVYLYQVEDKALLVKAMLVVLVAVALLEALEVEAVLELLV
jgi:hypothetical protein